MLGSWFACAFVYAVLMADVVSRILRFAVQNSNEPLRYSGLAGQS